MVTWLEVLLVGGAELYRNTELDPVKRCYPGGYFDPLSLASGSPDEVFRLQEAEIKHGRLAMIAVLGERGFLFLFVISCGRVWFSSLFWCSEPVMN